MAMMMMAESRTRAATYPGALSRSMYYSVTCTNAGYASHAN
jgi:hypothetical protein